MEQKTEKPNFDLLSLVNKTGRAVGSILVASVVFVNTDKSLGYEVWHGKETAINNLNTSEKYNDEKTWVVLPGLGVQSGKAIASVLRPVLSRSGNIAYADYSDDGINIPKLASSIKSIYLDTGQPVSFYAHSMGGTITMKLLAELNNEVPINDIVFDCSPYDIDDAKDTTAPLASAVAPIYGGGLISKTIAEVRNNVFIHKNDRLSSAQQLTDAGRIAITGSSPRLFTDQLKELGKINPANYIKFIPETTRIYFISPDNLDNDETVYDENSYSSWNDLFGGRVIRIIVKNGGHANPTQRPTEYYNAIWPYFIGLYQEPLANKAN